MTEIIRIDEGQIARVESAWARVKAAGASISTQSVSQLANKISSAVRLVQENLTQIEAVLGVQGVTAAENRQIRRGLEVAGGVAEGTKAGAKAGAQLALVFPGAAPVAILAGAAAGLAAGENMERYRAAAAIAAAKLDVQFQLTDQRMSGAEEAAARLVARRRARKIR